MGGYKLPVSVASRTLCPDEEDPSSTTMLSFALAVAGQIEDQTLKAGLSAGLAAGLERDPAKLSVSEVVALACVDLDELCQSRRAAMEAITRSRSSLMATRTLLRSIAQG